MFRSREFKSAYGSPVGSVELSPVAYSLPQKPSSNWFSRTFDSNRVSQDWANYNSALDRQFNALEAEKTRQFNALEAEKARQFELDMSNTAYQRGVEDMRKAGLNPYLAYSQGGAPSYSSYSATSSPASTASRSGQYGNALGSAMIGTAGNLLGQAISAYVKYAIASL